MRIYNPPKRIIIRVFSPNKHMIVCLKETSQGDVSYTHPKHMIYSIDCYLIL